MIDVPRYKKLFHLFNVIENQPGYYFFLVYKLFPMHRSHDYIFLLYELFYWAW